MTDRRTPLQELMRIQKQMNAIFNEMIQPGGAVAYPLAGVSWIPCADVYEDSSNYFVEVELPGVFIKDVEVVCQDNILRISGDRKASEETLRQGVQRIERYSGPFLREFSFPDAIDETGVKASLKDGLLVLSIPREKSHKDIALK